MRRYARRSGCSGRSRWRGDEPAPVEAELMYERIAPEEHDSLDGVPEPSETVRVFGHQAQAAQLAAAHRAGKLPHGLVFAGPRGIGKASVAFQLAHYLLAHPEPESAPQTF